MAGALPKPRPEEGLGGGVTGRDDYGLIIKQALLQNRAGGNFEKIVSPGRDKVDKSVLAYFSAVKEVSLQDILKQTDLSYATLYTRLKSITRDGLLLRRRAGWRHLFRLNPAHPVVQKHLELVEVARCSDYLSAHPKREAILALLEEGAAATPLLTAFLLNGHSPSGVAGGDAGSPGHHSAGGAPAAHAPAGPGSPGPNGTSGGGDGSASQPPGASLRDAPVGKGHVGVAQPSPPPPSNGEKVPTVAVFSGGEEPKPPSEAELVFVVTEPEFAPRLARLAPKAREAGFHVRVQTPAEFRALVPYLNGSVPLAGTDYFLREKLRITYSGGDFAVQAGNGFLSVFVGAPEREFTIQEIQALARKSYKPTYFALQKLLGWGLLDHRREKWKHYFKLNLANPVVRKHLELEELRKGRASLSGLPTAERLAVGDLVNKAVRAIPLLAVLHRNSREGPTLYFVVQKRNGHGQALQPLWAAANLASLKPRLIEVKSLRALLGRRVPEEAPEGRDSGPGRGQNHFGVLYGEEFYLTQKLNALTSGNGHNAPQDGPGPAKRESPGEDCDAPPFHNGTRASRSGKAGGAPKAAAAEAP